MFRQARISQKSVLIRANTAQVRTLFGAILWLRKDGIEPVRLLEENWDLPIQTQSASQGRLDREPVQQRNALYCRQHCGAPEKDGPPAMPARAVEEQPEPPVSDDEPEYEQTGDGDRERSRHRPIGSSPALTQELYAAPSVPRPLKELELGWNTLAASRREKVQLIFKRCDSWRDSRRSLLLVKLAAMACAGNPGIGGRRC